MQSVKCKMKIVQAASPSSNLQFAFCIIHFAFPPLQLTTPHCLAETVPVAPPNIDSSQTTLANAFARLIENTIPRQYEKQKDWGKTKNVTVGVRNKGFKLYRRKKPVNHGVWKHYKLRLVEPEQRLQVRVENLRALDGRRVGLTLLVDAKLDTWARAKVYQYGIHLIALEVVGDATLRLALDCEVGVRVDGANVSIDPKITDAQLAIADFNLRRVSNARGPIVRELGDGLQHLIEEQLTGPRLVAKLNRAIDKKRDRLTIGLGDLWRTSWSPLASLPDLQRAVNGQR